MNKPVKRVREPVQVYLDERDLSILDALVERTSQSKAELLRIGIRRLSEELMAETAPGSSLSVLTGILDQVNDVPTDLAERHDEYLYGDNV